jgi:sporulation protein YlmC with PRC-barrel domain
MKRRAMKRFALTAVALALGLAFSANGAVADDKLRVSAFTLDSAHMDSKHLVGMSVNTPDGKRAGEIDHLIVNMKDGKVSHVIVGVGGLAGVGERHVVVPWSQVKIRHEGNDRKNVVAVIDRATLDNAPRYTRVDRDRVPAASPATAPAADRDRDGVPNRLDRAPSNPNKR